VHGPVVSCAMRTTRLRDNCEFCTEWKWWKCFVSEPILWMSQETWVFWTKERLSCNLARTRPLSFVCSKLGHGPPGTEKQFSVSNGSALLHGSRCKLCKNCLLPSDKYADGQMQPQRSCSDSLTSCCRAVKTARRLSNCMGLIPNIAVQMSALPVSILNLEPGSLLSRLGLLVA
jgi:hypothetical protein